jgi:transcriptional regulator with XRE-family HTH domain
MTTISVKIKAVRKRRGLTLQQLAEMTNLTKGYLSRIENTETPPPFTTLQTIARALNVDLNELLQITPPDNIEGTKDIQVMHAETLAAEGEPEEAASPYRFKPLVMPLRGKAMSPGLMELAQGRTQIFTHDGEEFVYVLQGVVTLHYEKDTYHLKAGDSFYADSRKPHWFENVREETVVMLVVNYDYRRF